MDVYICVHEYMHICVSSLRVTLRKYLRLDDLRDLFFYKSGAGKLLAKTPYLERALVLYYSRVLPWWGAEKQEVQNQSHNNSIILFYP